MPGHPRSLKRKGTQPPPEPAHPSQPVSLPGDGLPTLSTFARTRHALRSARAARLHPQSPPRPVPLQLPSLSVRPRFETPLPEWATHSFGPLAENWAAEAVGLKLLPWQSHALAWALACSETGAMAHRHVLISTARQNGKTTLVRALLDWALMLPGPIWPTVIGLAYDRKQAARIYTDVLVDVEGLGAYVTLYQGIRGPAGTLYDVASREARSNLRGLSVDLACFDEVATHVNTDVFDALLPTMVTSARGLLVGLSTAGTERSVLLRDWYDTGLRAAAGGLGLPGFGMLWYAAPEGADPDDPAALAAANPSLDVLLTPAALAYERARLTDGAYLRERLNTWTVSEDAIIPAAYWHARTDAAVPFVFREKESPGRVALALDTGHGWQRASIVAAFMSDTSGLPHLALVASLDAPGDRPALQPSVVLAELGALVAELRPERIVYDAASVLAPHVESVAAAADWPLVALTARQMTGAAANLEAHVLAGELTHDGSTVFAQQLAGAGRARSGDGWRFSRRASVTAIDAIVSASMALYALTRPAEVLPSGPFVT